MNFEKATKSLNKIHDLEWAEHGAILYYSVEQREDSYLPDVKSIKYHSTKYF